MNKSGKLNSKGEMIPYFSTEEEYFAAGYGWSSGEWVKSPSFDDMTDHIRTHTLFSPSEKQMLIDALVKNEERLQNYHFWDVKVLDREDYYRMKEWRDLRSSLISKNEFCELCGRPAEHVHHLIKFYDQDKEKRKIVLLEPTNLMCLCSECHHRVHNRKLRSDEQKEITRRKTAVCDKLYNEGVLIRYTND